MFSGYSFCLVERGKVRTPGNFREILIGLSEK
jgi:hypothetical protein